MFTLTEAAGARLAEKLTEKNAGGNVSLRFARQTEPRGWKLRLDKPSPADTALSHDGRVVLVFDEQSSHLLRNKVLDTRETDEGPRLQLRGA